MHGRADKTHLVRPLVLAQITAIRAAELAEPTLMRLLPLVQRRDVRLQLRVRRGGVPAAVAHVGAFARVRALVVVLGLVGRERLGAAREAARVGAVAGVREEVPRELGALLEVFGRGVARGPLAGAGGACVDVRGFDVLVEEGGGGEGGEAEDARGVLPFADAGRGGGGGGGRGGSGRGGWWGVQAGGGVEAEFGGFGAFALEGVGVVGLREEPGCVVEAVEGVVERVVEHAHACVRGERGVWLTGVQAKV